MSGVTNSDTRFNVMAAEVPSRADTCPFQANRPRLFTGESERQELHWLPPTIHRYNVTPKRQN